MGTLKDKHAKQTKAQQAAAKAKAAKAKAAREAKAAAKAAAAAAVVAAPAKLSPVETFHTGDRYGRKDQTTGRKIETRHLVERSIVNGIVEQINGEPVTRVCTLDDIRSLYGDGEAMKRTAALLTRGKINVAGFVGHPTNNSQKLATYWATIAEWKIKLLAYALTQPQAAVTMLVAPKHVSVCRRS